jgi:hypothetical protein
MCSSLWSDLKLHWNNFVLLPKSGLASGHHRNNRSIYCDAMCAKAHMHGEPR